jgi:hypothetical protein
MMRIRNISTHMMALKLPLVLSTIAALLQPLLGGRGAAAMNTKKGLRSVIDSRTIQLDSIQLDSALDSPLKINSVAPQNQFLPVSLPQRSNFPYSPTRTSASKKLKPLPLSIISPAPVTNAVTSQKFYPHTTMASMHQQSGNNNLKLHDTADKAAKGGGACIGGASAASELSQIKIHGTNGANGGEVSGETRNGGLREVTDKQSTKDNCVGPAHDTYESPSVNSSNRGVVNPTYTFDFRHVLPSCDERTIVKDVDTDLKGKLSQEDVRDRYDLTERFAQGVRALKGMKTNSFAVGKGLSARRYFKNLKLTAR